MNNCDKCEFDDHYPWFEHWNHSLLHGFLSCLETTVLTIRHIGALQMYAEIHYPFLTIWCVCLLVWECVRVPQIAVICFLPPDLWVSSAGSPGGKTLELTHCFHWGVHCKHTHARTQKTHLWIIRSISHPLLCYNTVWNALYMQKQKQPLLLRKWKSADFIICLKWLLHALMSHSLWTLKRGVFQVICVSLNST